MSGRILRQNSESKNTHRSTSNSRHTNLPWPSCYGRRFFIISHTDRDFSMFFLNFVRNPSIVSTKGSSAFLSLEEESPRDDILQMCQQLRSWLLISIIRSRIDINEESFYASTKDKVQYLDKWRSINRVEEPVGIRWILVEVIVEWWQRSPWSVGYGHGVLINSERMRRFRSCYRPYCLRFNSECW